MNRETLIVSTIASALAMGLLVLGLLGASGPAQEPPLFARSNQAAEHRLTSV